MTSAYTIYKQGETKNGATCRKARKSYTCHGQRFLNSTSEALRNASAQCLKIINEGDIYFEYYEGGYAQYEGGNRYCVNCAESHLGAKFNK